MTYVDPKNIPGAGTPTGGFICQKCRQAKQPTTQRTEPPKTVQMSIDELTQKKQWFSQTTTFLNTICDIKIPTYLLYHISKK